LCRLLSLPVTRFDLAADAFHAGEEFLEKGRTATDRGLGLSPAVVKTATRGGANAGLGCQI
jgi:hypothetical protein